MEYSFPEISPAAIIANLDLIESFWSSRGAKIVAQIDPIVFCVLYKKKTIKMSKNKKI